MALAVRSELKARRGLLVGTVVLAVTLRSDRGLQLPAAAAALAVPSLLLSLAAAAAAAAAGPVVLDQHLGVLAGCLLPQQMELVDRV